MQQQKFQAMHSSPSDKKNLQVITIISFNSIFLSSIWFSANTKIDLLIAFPKHGCIIETVEMVLQTIVLEMP